MRAAALRECGECTECCTMLEIPALKKPKKTRCKLLSDDCSGCGDYENRPQDCRGFQCAWSENQFPLEYRPDKLGIMVYYVDSDCTELPSWARQFKHIMFATETREGAFDKSPAQKEVILSLAQLKNIPVVLARYDGRAMMMVP